MQQQQAPHVRGPFPWVRTIALFVSLALLALLTAVLILATGHVIDSTWLYIAPPLVGLIGASMPIIQYIFPLAPVGPQQPPAPGNTPSPLPSQPTGGQVGAALFPYNFPQLPSPQEFYGRMSERTTLIARTHNGGVTALNGPRRIGKTWLMQYLKLVAPTHPDLGPNYRIGIVSATHPQCQTLAGFVSRALEALNVPVHALDPSAMLLTQLATAVKDLKAQQILPVLCIDEFEGFLGKAWFDGGFIEGLRAIAQDDGLVLIVAAKKTLREQVDGLISQTSQLYGMVQQLTLRPFSEAEASEFVTKKGQQAGLSDDERAFFLECAPLYRSDGTKEWPPLRLQLVGQMLVSDKEAAASQQQVFLVQDSAYQMDFKQRLKDQYQAVVKEP